LFLATWIGIGVINLNIKQNADQIVICRRLEDQAQDARLQMEDWRDQAERLEDKIELKNKLLNDLRRQRQRTGDDGFDIDIRQQEDRIRNLERQLPIALGNARQWEAQVAIIERQMVANNCDIFA